jgi:ABC-type spermidine/putrescine transport system permease subunit I
VKRRVREDEDRGSRRHRLLWPALAAPGTIWMVLLFVIPLYVVFAIAFGQVDPVFRSPIPVWNPLAWDTSQFRDVVSHILGSDDYLSGAFVRTGVYVLVATTLSLLIAYPVAYFTARLAGRYRGVILALLVAPFWISYMMRMLAWVNLLQPDGLANKVLSAGGLFPVHVNWLTGQPITVILGLAYGYVPYMILPLYAGLDRIPSHMLEASRDLGASRVSTLIRVTIPLSMPAILASVMLTTLPMLGDYFTSDMLSASPSTSMVGNLINDAVGSTSQTGQAASLVVILLVFLVIPMILYVRSTNRSEGARS